MDKKKFLLWIILLLLGLQLAGCTIYMHQPTRAEFEYQGNLIERDFERDQNRK